MLSFLARDDWSLQFFFVFPILLGRGIDPLPSCPVLLFLLSLILWNRGIGRLQLLKLLSLLHMRGLSKINPILSHGVGSGGPRNRKYGLYMDAGKYRLVSPYDVDVGFNVSMGSCGEIAIGELGL